MSREPTSQIIDILSTKVEQARAGDFVALLDLSKDATEDDIKKAYFRLARMVHPDTIRKQSLMDRKDEAAFIFEKVTEAFQILSDPDQRGRYLRGEPAQDVAPTNGKMLEEQAKIALHHGKMLLKRRSYSEAESHFREYSVLKPEDARGFLFLGWSLFQNKEKDLETRLEEAKTSFQSALKLDDANADAHYYLALYFKQREDFDSVGKHLKKALKIDPKHVPSQREQRLLEMRAQVEPDQPTIGDYLKNLWGKLNKKKGD
jgi:curved DNA-binding protein CbpA